MYEGAAPCGHFAASRLVHSPAFAVCAAQPLAILLRKTPRSARRATRRLWRECIPLQKCGGYAALFSAHSPHTYTTVELNAHLDSSHKVRCFTYTLTRRAKAERSGKPYPTDYRLICSYGARFHGVRDSFSRPGDALRARWNTRPVQPEFTLGDPERRG